MYSKYIYTGVNGCEYKHEADSGSDINLWPHNHFRQLCNKMGYTPELHKSTVPVRAANKTPIEILGWFNATLTSKHASRVVRIYVSKYDQDDYPLLSRHYLYQLGYLRMDPNGTFAAKSISEDNEMSDDEFNKAVKDLHEEFKEVFTGIGKYKHHTVDLKLKEGTQPFFLKAIPCPIHLRKQAQERLDYFIKLGILEPLPIGHPVKYCSPLLVVPKPHKQEVRFVVNYKKLNEALCRTRHVPAVGLQDFCRVTNGFKWFVRLDLRDAYMQIKLSEQRSE